MQWALQVVRGNEKKGRFDDAYRFFLDMFMDHAKFQILPFDKQDLEIYKGMTPATKRIGTVDCLIAATAIRHDHIVITLDKTDFEKIPGCKWADWSRPHF